MPSCRVVSKLQEAIQTYKPSIDGMQWLILTFLVALEPISISSRAKQSPIASAFSRYTLQFVDCSSFLSLSYLNLKTTLFAPSMDPGPSSRDLVPGSSPHEAALSPRRREKCPAAGVSLDDVQLDDSRLDQASISAKHNKIRAPLHAYTAQEIALLFSQYLHSRSQGHVARVIDEQLLGRTRSEARLEEIEAVERALLGGVSPHSMGL